MITQIVKNYTFDASAGTITFDDYSEIFLENVLIIVNKSYNNAIIHSSSSSARTGSVSGNVLTLAYNTQSMSDSDSLQIRYVQHPDSTFKSANTGAVAAIKNTPGKITGYYFFNLDTSPLHVKLFDVTAASVVLGTTASKLLITIPPGSGANVLGEREIGFNTAISIACTTGPLDSDLTVASANKVISNIYYNQ
jgi:hypothetical protein